jgi:hypothetical protein
LESDRANKYQQWFVPFDYTIKASDQEAGLTFYKINVITNSKEETSVDSPSTEVWVHLIPLSAGTVLKANKPYLVKWTTGGVTRDFITGPALLKGKNTDCVHTFNSGRGDFKFYGTYEATGYSDLYGGPDVFYYVSKNGMLGKGNSGATWKFKSYRWYFILESDDSYAPVFGFVEDIDGATDIRGAEFASDDDIEGYYTLNGVKVETPSKGVYIVKYNDGRTKKINLK